MRVAPAIAALCVTAVAALPRAAAACAVCACGDPTLTSMGAEQPLKGRLRVSLEGAHRTDTVGTAGIDQVALAEQTLTAGLAVSPADRWQVAVGLPVGRRVAQDASLARVTVLSLGDLTLRARWAAVRGQPTRGGALAGLSAGVRLPTAPVATAPGGDALPMSGQLGAGTTLVSGGLWGFLSGTVGALYASSAVALPVPPSLTAAFDSRPGASLRATAAAQLQPWTRLALRASLEGRADRPATMLDTGRSEPDTGGAVLFSRADLLVAPATDWVLQAGVSVPTVQALRGDHVEGPVFALGVVRDL